MKFAFGELTLRYAVELVLKKHNKVGDISLEDLEAIIKEAFARKCAIR